MFGVPEKLQLIVVPEGGHRPYQLEKPALRWLEEHFGLPFWTADFGIRNAECGIELRHRPSGEVELGPWCDAHGVPIEPLYNTDLHYRKAVTLDVGVHILPPADLACLEPGGFKDPQFSITGFVARLEERYPTPFTVPTDRAAWERRAAEIKAEVRRLLHVPEATSPPEVREVRSFDHDGYLGVELAYSEVGWTTFLFFPDATSARRDVVIYVPASRDKTQGSGSPPVCSQARECRSAGITRLGGDGTIVPDYELTPRLARWLAEGKCMAVLDAGAFDDWETALGDAGVAVNTRHVLETFAVLRQRSDIRLDTITVCSELRDVALYAGLAEERLTTIIAADGVPDGPRTPDRRAGLLPGIARIASHPELLAALAPRELLLTPDRETAAAWDSIRAVYALYGAADRVRWEE
jgi:hypothetical protein